MAEDDLVYLLRRAAEERRIASGAVNGEGCAARLGLADAYDERIRSADRTALLAGERLNG